MPFPIKNADWVFTELVKDADVKAELVVDNANNAYWLENIGIVVSQNPSTAQSNPDEKAFAKAGQPLPDFKLTNQDGKPISLKDFSGKALAITFIYARCPLPDYCIKMSTNFSDAANLLKDSESKNHIKLLTVSFDPENDTPAKLRQYGIGYLGKDSRPNFDIWQLAVGKDSEIKAITDFVGLRYETNETDKTQINHSLRTVIVSPDGKVSEVISGNNFTPQDLIRKLTATIK
jgi:protein SCO1